MPVPTFQASLQQETIPQRWVKLHKHTEQRWVSLHLTAWICGAYQYHLRNGNNLVSVPSRTSLYSGSFLPSTLREWNELPDDVRNSNSLVAFKAHLSRSKPQSNKLFYFGKRRLQVIYTRLRTKCSTLFHHLFLKNIVDSPLCRCGSIETTTHFFLECSRYDHIRPILYDRINQLTSLSLHTLLYGDETKSFQINIEIFKAVHKFIEGSKRFET